MARISDVQYKKQSNIDENNADESAAYFQNSKPPPAPPGGDDLWELQFCRWWGWNWVRRQQQSDQNCGGYQCEAQRDQIYDKSRCPPSCPLQRKVKKKHIWDLCKFLCCKKKKKHKEYPCLQSMYTTPSNSTTMCRINMCGKFNDDTFVNLEEQRNISRKEKSRSPCRRRKDRKRSMVRVKHEWSGTSSVEYTCGSTRPRSSTEESIEFINVSCGCRCQKESGKIENANVKVHCPCQKVIRSESPSAQPDLNVPICPRKARPTVSDLMLKQLKDKSCRCDLLQQQRKGCDCQTQTIGEEPMQSVRTTVRKKRKLVVTCHCCCCKCMDTSGTQASKFNQSKSICDCSTCDRKQKNQKYIETNHKPTKSDILSTKIPSSTLNQCQNAQIQNRVMERLFDNPIYFDKYLPWNTAGYSKKYFPKHGVAQMNHHPWLQQTQSDISDRIHSFRLEDEFASPVSGKIYSVSPVKVNKMDTIIQKKLPEPIEVSDEMQYLRKLESEAKMDLSSRLVMDAVCDAILSTNQDVECFSTLLSQVNYDQKSVGERICPLEDDLLCRKSTNDFLLNNIYRDFNTFKPTEADTNPEFQQNKSENIVDEVDKLVDKLLRSNKSKEEVKSKGEGMFQRYGLQKAFDGDDNSDFYPESNFRSTYKRSASPTFQFQDHTKKLRTMENLPDLEDIFKKIDEIALKSKKNNIRINQVLGSIQQEEVTAGTSTDYDPQESTNKILNRINDFSYETNGRDCVQIEDIVKGDNIKDNNQTDNGEDVVVECQNNHILTDEDHSRDCSKSSKDTSDRSKKKGNNAQSMIPIKKSSRLKNNKKK